MAKGINIGGGWLKQSDKGDSISIRFNEASLTINPTQHWISLYPNSYKKKPNEPDYNLVATPKTVTTRTPPPQQRASAFPKPKNHAPQASPRAEESDLDKALDGPPPDLWERSDYSDGGF